MNTRSTSLALLTSLLLSAPAALAAQAVDQAVDDKAFDEQAQVIQEGMELTQESGLFGRPGERPGEGPRASAVGDRDLDRYVQRLAVEIRMRNAIADRDPEGFR